MLIPSAYCDESNLRQKQNLSRKKNKCRALSRILNDRFNEYSVYIILDLLIKIDVSYDAK